jgi:hypothetical protein
LPRAASRPVNWDSRYAPPCLASQVIFYCVMIFSAEDALKNKRIAQTISLVFYIRSILIPNNKKDLITKQMFTDIWIKLIFS